MTPQRTIGSYVRLLVVVGWMVVSITAIVNGYRSTSPVLAWQMFPEASTWRATVDRVTADGSHIDVRDAWPGGYRWDEMVVVRGLGAPFVEGEAPYGVASTLDMLQHALDWVAKHTPADDETLFLEASVEYRHNADDPQVTVMRSATRNLDP